MRTGRRRQQTPPIVCRRASASTATWAIVQYCLCPRVVAFCWIPETACDDLDKLPIDRPSRGAALVIGERMPLTPFSWRQRPQHLIARVESQSQSGRLASRISKRRHKSQLYATIAELATIESLSGLDLVCLCVPYSSTSRVSWLGRLINRQMASGTGARRMKRPKPWPSLARQMVKQSSRRRRRQN